MLGETDSEQNILNLVRRGEHAAQKALYTTYVRYLSAICSRYIANDEDVKDVLQESFIKIFSAIRDFRYRGPGSLKGWVARIVVNESLKYLQQNTRIEFVELAECENRYCEDSPALELVPSEVLFCLIRELPDGYRTIFNLFVIEGKSHKEIASMLGIRESTSASQLHRAKAMLAYKIRQYDNSNT